MTEEEYKQRAKDMRNRVATLRREGKYWSDDDVKRLRVMFSGGTGITEIAVFQDTGCSGCFESQCIQVL